MRLLWLVCILLTGCYLDLETTSSPNQGTSNSASDSAWQTIALGLEQRTYQTETGVLLEVVRIDPTYYQFRVHYRAGEPLTLKAWREQLPNVAAFINANFFDPQYQVLGLLVSDGQVYGRSYRNGGTFVVQNGIPRVRATEYEPYQGEALEQAVQAFPLLVYNTQAAFTNSQELVASRRSVIGQDSQGRILLMVTPGFGLGLYPLSQYLATTDMDLVTAFNLDGGGSALLYSAPTDYGIPSFDAVPAVLAVYAR